MLAKRRRLTSWRLAIFIERYLEGMFVLCSGHGGAEAKLGKKS